MRRVFGRNGRRAREQLSRARVAGGRREDSHDRRHRPRRASACRAGGIPRTRRRAMRNLHAGHDARRRESSRAASSSHRRGNSRRARRKSLPLHRLQKIFESVVARVPRDGAAARESRTFPHTIWTRRAILPRLSSAGARAGRMEAVRRRHRSDGSARSGKAPHRKFLSIWKLPELRGIEVTPDHVTLGALTTYTEVRRTRNARARISAAVPRRR